MPSAIVRMLQVASLVVTSLLVGSMFGIWRGFDPASFSPSTFVEVQQGAIRGLNTLLPGMGIAAVVLTIILAFLARARSARLLYVGAALALAVAGAVTRFENQPINEMVMGWTGLPPEGWQAWRDLWWNWHLTRLAAAFAGEILLINAVLSHVAARGAVATVKIGESLATPT